MFSQITLVGNLGGDPELKEFGDKKVCNFSIATNKKWKEEGETKSKTQWFNVSVWGEYGKSVSNTLKKGSRVVLTGEPRNNKTEKGNFTDVIAEKIIFL